LLRPAAREIFHGVQLLSVRAIRKLLNNDIVQKLASPPRIEDVSWIEPGQVAWDYGMSGIFHTLILKAGLNMPTCKYYIDFAAANKMKYAIIEGALEMDLTKMSPKINLPELIDYAHQKGVGIITWASWYQATLQMDTVFPLYAKNGSERI